MKDNHLYLKERKSVLGLLDVLCLSLKKKKSKWGEENNLKPMLGYSLEKTNYVQGKNFKFLARPLHMLSLRLEPRPSPGIPHRPAKFLFRLPERAPRPSLGRQASARGRCPAPSSTYSTGPAYVPTPGREEDLGQHPGVITFVSRINPNTATPASGFYRGTTCCSFVSPAVPYTVSDT